MYRHFPTREALVDAVYRDQVTRLTSGADALLAELTPAMALRQWMDLFGDAGRATGEIRADITTEDIAASLIEIFTVAPLPEQHLRAGRLLDILTNGLRPTR